MESFFKSFKVEEVYHENCETHEPAVRAATDYIERFYNPKRLHSTLGYVSPNEFEQRKLYERKKGGQKSAFVGAIRRSLARSWRPTMVTKKLISKLPLWVIAEKANPPVYPIAKCGPLSTFPGEFHFMPLVLKINTKRLSCGRV